MRILLVAMCLVSYEGCAAATLWPGAVEATCLLPCAAEIYLVLFLVVSLGLLAADCT